MYLSGKDRADHPLPPNFMMEDIMGDYRETTATIENFPHQEGVVCVSIHPCRHAAVMKSLMARANNALKLRREKQRMAQAADNHQASDALSGDMNKLKLSGGARNEYKGNAEDEWEVVETNDNSDEDEVAIRVDQYLVVFLKVRKRPDMNPCAYLQDVLSLWLRSSQMLKLTTRRLSERAPKHKITKPSFGLGLQRQFSSFEIQMD